MTDNIQSEPVKDDASRTPPAKSAAPVETKAAEEKGKVEKGQAKAKTPDNPPAPGAKKDDKAAAASAAEKQPKAGAKPPSKPRAVIAGSVAVIALVAALGAGAGSYWLWQQVTVLQARTVELSDSGSADRQALAGRIDSLSSDLSNNLSAIRERQQALDSEMKSLYTRLGSSAKDWMIAEAEYLMQVANQRLELARDVNTAIAALGDADQRLKQVGDPALLKVRQDIAKEITALRAVDTPDVAGMSLTLKGLQQQVPQLPLLARYRPQPAETVVTAQPQPPEVEGWRGFFQAVWESLKSLVVIRYNEKPVTPLLPPEQVQNLYENLELKLESARLALLQQNQAVFRSTLETAGDWVKAYFDTDAQAVTSMLNTLGELGRTDIRPPLPDISGSLRTLRQAAAQVEGQSPAASGAAAETAS